MRRSSSLAGRHLDKLLLLGLAGVAWHNCRLWQRDKALLARKKEAEPLQALETWPDLPLISVLVGAWNEAGTIEQHIKSFLRLRYPRKELVLCAGGDDGTYDLAEAFASDQVLVLRQDAGEGKQRALRRCLERAGGSIIFLTDADCLLDDEAFERTIAPLISEGEMVATGTSKPVSAQRANAFVLHQWFIQLGAAVRSGEYVDGLLGRNAALNRDVLEAIGGFDADVRTGTDYCLAKQVLHHGYRIRHVPDTAVETAFPVTPGDYRRQQSRWLRNVVLHGLRSESYAEVVRAAAPSILGTLMLAGPFLSLLLGPVAVAGWLAALSHALISRVRYMRFGVLMTGCPFPVIGYLSLPTYMAFDLITWASTLLQYFSKRHRAQW